MNAARVELPSTPAFPTVLRFRERKTDEVVAKVRPGDFYVTTENERLSTLLGSCIAACIRDARSGIGGMNHFLLPSREAEESLRNARYGNFAMEALINEIFKHGGSRRHLEAKVFGGASVIEGMSRIGDQNAEFVEAYLEAEGIPIRSRDLGGDHGRLIQFWPRTGRARLKRLRDKRRLADREVVYHDRISTESTEGSIELF